MLIQFRNPVQKGRFLGLKIIQFQIQILRLIAASDGACEPSGLPGRVHSGLYAGELIGEGHAFWIDFRGSEA